MKILAFFLMTILFPIAALAAEEASVTAVIGLTSNDLALIIKVGVPSGLITGALSLLGIWWTNRNTQKNNREKIAAEASNLSRQLSQRQSEFEIQTKMQIGNLHSDEKKKVCWDFVASVNPSLFPKKQFDLEKMHSCVTPLYLYSHDTYLSYFENLIEFITVRRLSTFGESYERIRREVEASKKRVRECELALEKNNRDVSGYDLAYYDHEAGQWIERENIMLNILKSYTQHYELAVNAAKKLIWNEPIEKAQPLQWKDIPDEDEE